MVSSGLAAAMVARSDPAPLSWLFMTVSVAGVSRPSRISSLGTNGRRWPCAFWRRSRPTWFRSERRVRQRNREVNGITCVSFLENGSAGTGRGIRLSAQTKRREGYRKGEACQLALPTDCFLASVRSGTVEDSTCWTQTVRGESTSLPGVGRCNGDEQTTGLLSLAQVVIIQKANGKQILAKAAL